MRLIKIVDKYLSVANMAAVGLAGAFAIWQLSLALLQVLAPLPTIVDSQNVQWAAPVSQMSSSVSLDRVKLFPEADTLSQSIPEEASVIESNLDLENIRETRLSLSLKAVMAAQPKSESAVVIENNGQQQVYFIGDSLPVTGQVYVNEVFGTTVLLSNNGALERLSLNDDFTQLGRVLSSSTPAASSTISRPSNEFALSEFMTLRPILDGGDINGFRITNIVDPRVSDVLDIQAGDVIKQINGRDVSTFQTEQSLIEFISEQDTIQLNLARDGKIKNVAVSTRMLSVLR